MVERTFILANRSGLHARPAALFIQTVQRFPGTDVVVRKGEREGNGRSLLSVLALGVGPGTEILVRCTGLQELDAMAALAELIEAGFGE